MIIENIVSNETLSNMTIVKVAEDGLLPNWSPEVIKIDIKNDYCTKQLCIESLRTQSVTGHISYTYRIVLQHIDKLSYVIVTCKDKELSRILFKYILENKDITNDSIKQELPELFI